MGLVVGNELTPSFLWAGPGGPQDWAFGIPAPEREGGGPQDIFTLLFECVCVLLSHGRVCSSILYRQRAHWRSDGWRPCFHP